MSSSPMGRYEALTSGVGREDADASELSGIEMAAEPNAPSFSFVIFHERESTELRAESVRIAGLLPKCFS